MTDRVEIGKRSDNTYGIRVSLPGYSVATATPDQLVFDSDWGGFGVVHQSGEVSYTGSGTTTVNFPALPYIPMIFTYVTRTSDNFASQKLWSYSLNFGQGEYIIFPAILIQNDHFKIDSSFITGGYYTAFTLRYAVLLIRGAT